MTEQTAERVQIRDFSDREMLAILVDLNSKTSARMIALRIFGIAELEANEAQIVHAARCVTSRLVWMRRYGLIARHEDGDWFISDEGEALRTGKVAASIEGGINNMKEEASLTLANVVGEKLVVLSEISGRAMQRELVHQINRRRSRLKGW